MKDGDLANSEIAPLSSSVTLLYHVYNAVVVIRLCDIVKEYKPRFLFKIKGF